MRRSRQLAVALTLALALAGCGSSSDGGLTAPTVAPARTFGLTGFAPTGAILAGHGTKLRFGIRQPSGHILKAYKTGAGPHTGVHLIIVRDDLAYIIHRHPPVDADGILRQTVVFPTPGRYRVLVDAYPARGAQPNFQLTRDITVGGNERRRRLPPFKSVQVVGGYRFTMHGTPRLHAIRPAFLTVTVTDPRGHKAKFQPWYGALAHAIFFRSGSLDYFHTHVCSRGAPGCTSTFGRAKVTGTSTTPGRLQVGVLVPISGTWELFLQCQVGGNTLTAHYTLKVS